MPESQLCIPNCASHNRSSRFPTTFIPSHPFPSFGSPIANNGEQREVAPRNNNNNNVAVPNPSRSGFPFTQFYNPVMVLRSEVSNSSGACSTSSSFTLITNDNTSCQTTDEEMLTLLGEVVDDDVNILAGWLKEEFPLESSNSNNDSLQYHLPSNKRVLEQDEQEEQGTEVESIDTTQDNNGSFANANERGIIGSPKKVRKVSSLSFEEQQPVSNTPDDLLYYPGLQDVMFDVPLSTVTLPNSSPPEAWKYPVELYEKLVEHFGLPTNLPLQLRSLLVNPHYYNDLEIIQLVMTKFSKIKRENDPRLQPGHDCYEFFLHRILTPIRATILNTTPEFLNKPFLTNLVKTYFHRTAGQNQESVGEEEDDDNTTADSNQKTRTNGLCSAEITAFCSENLVRREGIAGLCAAFIYDYFLSLNHVQSVLKEVIIFNNNLLMEFTDSLHEIVENDFPLQEWLERQWGNTIEMNRLFRNWLVKRFCLSSAALTRNLGAMVFCFFLTEERIIIVGRKFYYLGNPSLETQMRKKLSGYMPRERKNNRLAQQEQMQEP
jgi:hypothetical protein